MLFDVHGLPSQHRLSQNAFLQRPIICQNRWPYLTFVKQLIQEGLLRIGKRQYDGQSASALLDQVFAIVFGSIACWYGAGL